MENHVSKNWPIWGLVLVMGFSFYWVAKSWNSGKVIVSADESYEMIRPNSFEPRYDLSGRKIVRSLEKQRVASNEGPEALRQPMSPKAPTAPAKIADSKKAAQAKKNNKKSSLVTRVIPGNSKPLTAEAFEKSISGKTSGYSNYYPQTQNKDNQNTSAQDTNKVSSAQWRDLLLSSPTVENADKFLAAYKKGEVDAGSFYAISDELLSNADKNRQQAGLQILSKEYSAESFEIMAKHYSSASTPTDLKSGLSTAIQSYGQSSRISILSKSLASSDEVVAEVATEVLSSVVALQGTTQTQGDRGGIRSPGSSSQIDKSTWQNLLPSLQRLAASTNTGLAERAQSLIDSIQSLTSG